MTAAGRPVPTPPWPPPATEVRTEETALGSLVSVPLRTSLDTGGERFGFYLPQITITRGQSAQFRTAGVYEDFGGPDSVPPRPSSSRSIELYGGARRHPAQGVTVRGEPPARRPASNGK